MGKKGLNDFWDWISPMIVRELRQGTRTHIFSAAFILMLVALVLVMLTSLVAGELDGTDTSEGFWLCVAFALTVVMPLRGFSSIANEEKSQTMDMLLLTRLSAGRIMFGKWAALFSQTLLLASALLPFVVLRYFLGGVDLPGESLSLLMLVAISGLLTSLTICLSTQRSVVLRSIVVAVIAFLFIDIMEERRVFRLLISGGFDSSNFDSIEFVSFLVKFFLICVFAGYFLLAMGASQFAPLSENHAARKRLIAVFFLILAAVLHAFGVIDLYGVRQCLLVLVIPVIDALTEKPAPTVSVCMPYMKRGKFLRMWRWALYPGWQSGLIFLLLIVAGYTVIQIASPKLDASFDMRSAAFISANFGTILFPAAILWFVFPNAPSPLGRYLVIFLLSLMLCTLVGEFGEGFFLWVLFPLPVSSVLLLEGRDHWNDYGIILTISLISTGCWVSLLICRIIPVLRQFREVERECLALMEEEKESMDSGPDSVHDRRTKS